MVYLRLPAVIVTALIIIIWTLYIPIHNKEVNTLQNIKQSTFNYKDDNFEAILKSKNFFKKGIVKTNNKFIERANHIKDENDAIKIVSDVQGWFIGKDKFSWMWLTKKQATHNFYKQVFENTCYVIQQKIILLK